MVFQEVLRDLEVVKYDASSLRVWRETLFNRGFEC